MHKKCIQKDPQVWETPQSDTEKSEVKKIREAENEERKSQSFQNIKKGEEECILFLWT